MKDALKIALKAIDDKKGSDIAVLDLSGIASFADCFLICTGGSARQNQAMADEVEVRLKARGSRALHIEGYANAEWILMDYADLVVHIFSRNARAYYNLERLWRDGKRLDPEKLLQEKPAKSVRKTAKKVQH